MADAFIPDWMPSNYWIKRLNLSWSMPPLCLNDKTAVWVSRLVRCTEFHAPISFATLCVFAMKTPQTPIFLILSLPCADLHLNNYTWHINTNIRNIIGCYGKGTTGRCPDRLSSIHCTKCAFSYSHSRSSWKYRRKNIIAEWQCFSFQKNHLWKRQSRNSPFLVVISQCGVVSDRFGINRIFFSYALSFSCLPARTPLSAMHDFPAACGPPLPPVQLLLSNVQRRLAHAPCRRIRNLPSSFDEPLAVLVRTREGGQFGDTFWNDKNVVYPSLPKIRSRYVILLPNGRCF